MKLTITKTNGQKKYDNLDSITLPADSGNMEILAGHSEAFINLIQGEIIFRSKNYSQKEEVSTQSFCHVKDDLVLVIA